MTTASLEEQIAQALRQARWHEANHNDDAAKVQHQRLDMLLDLYASAH